LFPSGTELGKVSNCKSSELVICHSLAAGAACLPSIFLNMCNFSVQLSCNSSTNNQLEQDFSFYLIAQSLLPEDTTQSDWWNTHFLWIVWIAS